MPKGEYGLGRELHAVTVLEGARHSNESYKCKCKYEITL